MVGGRLEFCLSVLSAHYKLHHTSRIAGAQIHVDRPKQHNYWSFLLQFFMLFSRNLAQEGPAAPPIFIAFFSPTLPSPYPVWRVPTLSSPTVSQSQTPPFPKTIAIWSWSRMRPNAIPSMGTIQISLNPQNTNIFVSYFEIYSNKSWCLIVFWFFFIE